jgi:sugar lactone lactonase YvrE
MYLADSAQGTIHTFPIDPATGDLESPTLFVQITAGSPDGMIVDDSGNLWVAIWGRGQVRQYAPDGALLTIVPVPTQQPTALCLGGPERRQLFITTAAFGLNADERGLSGSVFALDVSDPGPPAYAFG